MAPNMKNTLLIAISLVFGLSACSKSLKTPAELPTAQSGYENTADEETTFNEEETKLAAQGVFGSGAETIARLIEKLYTTHGRPTAYITGTEVSGAFIAGGRFGQGVLHHKLEGDSPIKWWGPSLGFDLGLSGGESFVLIYNLYDPEKLYQWVPAGEGQAYLMGGFNVSYQGDQGIVLVTVKLGLGLRLGVNVGINKYYRPGDKPPVEDAEMADITPNQNELQPQ